MGMCVPCKNITCLNHTSMPEDMKKPKNPIDNNISKNTSNLSKINNDTSLIQVKSSSLTREPSFTLNQNNSLKDNNNNNNQPQSNNPKLPFTNFEVLMLNEINSVRINPKNYSLKLKNLMPMINSNQTKNKIFLVYDDDIKIELKKGTTAFKACIDYLNGKTISQLEPIELIEELKIPFPSDNTALCLDKGYISKHIDIIRDKVKNKYEIYDFQYDISPNPVLSTVIQVVDDTNANFQRRNNIMSDAIKYVGISYGEIKKGIYCFYLLFAC